MSTWSLKSLGERVASGLEKGLQDLENSIQQQASNRAQTADTRRVQQKRATAVTSPASSQAEFQQAPGAVDAPSPVASPTAVVSSPRAPGNPSPAAAKPGETLPSRPPALAALDGIYAAPLDVLQAACRVPLPDSPASRSNSLDDGSPGLQGQTDLGAAASDNGALSTMASTSVPSSASPYRNLLQQEAALCQLVERMRLASPSPGAVSVAEELERRAHDLVSGVRILLERAEKLDDPASPPAPQHDSNSLSVPLAPSPELAGLRADLSKAQEKIKAEEEKRSKSIALLKAVRQKLAQAEKERTTLIEEAKAGAEAAQRERVRFEAELTNLRASQEQQINKLRISFDRETNSIRAQYEREAVARKGQYELDAVTARAAHQKELATREAKTRAAETERATSSADRDKLFGQLQASQAQAEAFARREDEACARMEELERDLETAQDRVSSLGGELDTLRAAESDAASALPSRQRWDEEVRDMHEAALDKLRQRIALAEKERNDIEASLGRALDDRSKEVERLRKHLAEKDEEYATSVRSARDKDAAILEATGRADVASTSLRAAERRESKSADTISRLQEEMENIREKLRLQKLETADAHALVEEAQSREASLKAATKTLREDVRKLQSGVLLSEKQRNPGVGYFATLSGAGPSTPGGPPDALGANGDAARGQHKALDEAEVNYEYLRNTLLQFLEHREMRPHLVRVLAVILRFTPEETRRLSAKAAS